MTAASNAARSLAAGPDPRVTQSVRDASRATGVDFGFLMAQAMQESGGRADAKSATSSATGLFQFVESTWLDMVRRVGAKHGQAQLAAQVTLDGSGRPSVADAETRRKILDLRNDPGFSAKIAGEYARANKDELERALGRTARSTDLYLAHFLGPGGASEFLRRLDKDGATKAADLLPEAASANRAVFYDQTGEKRSVAEIYRRFADRIEKESAGLAVASGDAPSLPAEPRLAGTAGARLAATALRPGLPSGVHLSEPVAQMLNVIALSAMKLVGSSSEQPAATPRRDDRNL